MLFKQDQKIVFIGDSITDAGRRDEFAPYGDGYMSLVRALVLARYPELRLRFENRGIGGDTVRHLDARWDADVIAERPDWLSVKIGINDVWRFYDADGFGAVPPDEYEGKYRRLLGRAVDETGCRLIIADPYMIEPDRAHPMRAQMDAYAAVARRLADEFGAVHVATQQAIDAALTSSVPDDWSDDQIHPNFEGHAVIALAFLRAIGWEL